MIGESKVSQRYAIALFNVFSTQAEDIKRR